MKNIELKLIEPITVGVSNRIKIGVDINNNYYIVKNIKSRIIMKDGKKINETANTIIKQTKKNARRALLGVHNAATKNRYQFVSFYNGETKTIIIPGDCQGDNTLRC